MRISLIVSLLIHLAIVLFFQKAMPLKWAEEVFRTYQVELIRPPVEDINVEEAAATSLAHMQQEKREVIEKDQDTISLDTEDKRYVHYARVVKERIMHQWQYPPRAMEDLLEGRLTVNFSLRRDGQVIQIRILVNSGYDILDREAVRAVSSAAPFPSFPDQVTVGRLNINAAFDYRLTKKGSSGK
ncbi:MAG: energy transducer TonB [Pseudomonadota bacterium]